jgi:hypothetical protein
MPNLIRLTVLASKGDNSGSAPPAAVAALAQALDGAAPRAQLDLQDAYFNSAAMHQSFKQKMEAVDPSLAHYHDVVVEPVHLMAHKVDVSNPNVWTSTFGTGGGMIYEVSGTSWFLGISFQ